MPIIQEIHIPGKTVREKVVRPVTTVTCDEITVSAGDRLVTDTPEVCVSSPNTVYVEVFDGYADCGLGSTFKRESINELGLKQTIKPGKVFHRRGGTVNLTWRPEPAQKAR